MPDPQTTPQIQTVPTAAEQDIMALPRLLQSTLQELGSWLSTTVLALPFAYQVGALLVISVLAWRLTRVLSGKVYGFVHQHTDDDDPWLRRIGRHADELVFFAGVMVGLYAAGYAYKAAALDHGALFAAANLATAWVLIRMVSSVVVNPFWSKLFALFAWSVTALNILGLLGTSARLLDSFAFSMGDSRISAYLLFKAVLVGALLLWGAFAIAHLAQSRINKINELTPSVRELIVKILRFGLILLAILIALNAAGIDLTALAVFSGALGIGIGFGLQKVVSNFISGIIVLLDRSIRPSDVIEIGGTFGRVVRLGARYTSVITRDGHEFLIPNEDLITKEVINWSYSDRNVRRKVAIGVSYTSDIELARTLIVEAARETPRILDFPSPLCHLKGFGDSSVDLEARFWLSDPENGVTNVQSDFLCKVWAKFQDNNVSIPFPQRDVNFSAQNPIAVNVSYPKPAPPIPNETAPVKTSKNRRRGRRKPQQS